MEKQRPNQFKERAEETMPRERMRMASSPSELTPQELLAIILKTGAPGCDVAELSQRVIKCFGSVVKFVKSATDWRAFRKIIAEHNKKCDPSERILGIGEIKMLELAAAFELARRGFSGDDDGDNGMPAKISGVKQAVTAFSVGLRGKREQENFFVLPINTKLVPLSEPICISRGTLSSTPAHPREVFREAVRWGAHAIFICHNHPSGDVAPSDEDKALTKRLVDVGKLVAIPVVDHIILGSSPTSDKYFSMREEGMMGK